MSEDHPLSPQEQANRAQYYRDSIAAGPARDEAAAALLRLALHYAGEGYPLTVALDLIGVEEIHPPDPAFELAQQRWVRLRAAGVREAHLFTPTNRVLAVVRAVVFPGAPADTVGLLLVDEDDRADAPEILTLAIEFLGQAGAPELIPGDE